MRRPLNALMVRVALVALLLVAGCSPASHPTGAVSTQPSASASASQVAPPPAPTSTSPSPVVDLLLSTVDFSCRLPVTRVMVGGDFASYQGGFLTFPQATFAPDPAGVINSEYLARDLVTTAKPVLHGTLHTGPPFYDLALKRWIPAGAGQASPYGASYAYAVADPANPGAPFVIHVVGVEHGTDRNFAVPRTPDFGDANGAYLADFDGAFVYFSSPQSNGTLQGFLLIAFTPGGDVATVYDGVRELWFGAMQADTGGRLWFGNDRGIYLYTPGRGLRKVFAIGGIATLEEVMQPAGFCT